MQIYIHICFSSPLTYLRDVRFGAWSSLVAVTLQMPLNQQALVSKTMWREMVGRRVEKKIVVEGGGCLMKHKSEANKYFLSSFYICRVLSFFKKTDLFETQRDRERFHPLINHLPKYQPGVGKATARDQELHIVSHTGGRGPNIWASICCLPGALAGCQMRSGGGT